MLSKGMGLSNLSTKRKSLDKTICLPKKPKVAVGLAVRENPDVNKLPPLSGLGKGKSLMTSQGPVTEKRPILLRGDSLYALKQLLSIIKDDDYENLGNHATKAMGETGLFSLAQVCISILLLSIMLSLYFSKLYF